MSAHKEGKPESPFFTVKEAAAYARCSVRTLERRIERGALPCYRIGRKRLIRKGDLEADLVPNQECRKQEEK